MRRHARVALASAILLGGAQAGARSPQQADPNFDAGVVHPAFHAAHPKILFDEAHNNRHKLSDTYRPFADLVTNDGYRVVPNREELRKNVLVGYGVLVIAGALGSANADSPDRASPAFTEQECDVIQGWVRDGGALLLVTDHAPYGAAAARLAARFGVEVSNARTADLAHFERKTLDASWILFSRENGGLADHAITRGRDPSERIHRVMSFTGESLKGPKGSLALLRLSDQAYDVVDFDHPAQARIVSAAGRSQAVVLAFGKGRVAVFGEAAMLSAQNVAFGMNYPGTDNRQFVLNLMHWLSGLLP